MAKRSWVFTSLCITGSCHLEAENKLWKLFRNLQKLPKKTRVVKLQVWVNLSILVMKAACRCFSLLFYTVATSGGKAECQLRCDKFEWILFKERDHWVLLLTGIERWHYFTDKNIPVKLTFCWWSFSMTAMVNLHTFCKGHTRCRQRAQQRLTTSNRRQ